MTLFGKLQEGHPAASKPVVVMVNNVSGWGTKYHVGTKSSRLSHGMLTIRMTVHCSGKCITSVLASAFPRYEITP